MNLFRIIFKWLLLVGATHTVTADLGFLLRNLLLKSADLSSYKAPPPIPARPPITTTTTTTTAATTTAQAPNPSTPSPLPPPPPFQRGFYKTIPGLGRIGFDFGFGGIVGRPFPRPPPGNGYIDFDYFDNYSTPSTTPAATTAAPTTTAAAPTTTTPSPPVFTRRPQRPVRPQNPQPQPPQNGAAYPYYDPYYGPQRGVRPRPQPYGPNAPAYYNFYDQQRKYNGIYGARPESNYDYTDFNNGPPPFAAGRFQAQQRYVYRTRNAIASPVIGPPISRAQLNDNLVYQYAPNDDIYSNEAGGDDTANSDGDAGSSNGENNDVPPANNADDGNSISPDYNGDGYYGNAADAVPTGPANGYAVAGADAAGDDGGVNTATNAPDSEPIDTKVDYVDNSAPSDISSPTNIQLNNPNYAYTNNNDAAPHAPPNSPTATRKFFIQPESFPDDGHTSFASVRFRSPHVDYHTISMNRRHPGKY